MKKIEVISLRKLQQIASGTALTHNLTPIHRGLISRMYFMKGTKNQPLIKRCENGTLWVDKFYVAYQIGDGDVHYTYIARQHLVEEVNAYREAARLRKTDVQLPEDIKRCFRIAQRNMEATDRSYWIAAPWAKRKS